MNKHEPVDPQMAQRCLMNPNYRPYCMGSLKSPDLLCSAEFGFIRALKIQESRNKPPKAELLLRRRAESFGCAPFLGGSPQSSLDTNFML